MTDMTPNLHPFSRMYGYVDTLNDEQRSELFIKLCGFALASCESLGILKPGLDGMVMEAAPDDVVALLSAFQLDVSDIHRCKGRLN